MTSPRRPRVLVRAAAGALTALSLLVAGLAAPSVAAAEAGAGPVRTVNGRPVPLSRLKLAPTLSGGDPERLVSVFVRTPGAGALRVDAEAKRGRLAGTRPSAQAQNRVKAVAAQTTAVAAAARRVDQDSRTLYTTAYTVPGIALTTRAKDLSALAERSDVVSVSPIVPKTLISPASAPAAPQNAASDVYTRTVQTWQQTGYTGQDVKVAVIDSGLDYTHADFGGPGTTTAYEAARASREAPSSGWYDPAKYLGGYDFAGATYDADPSSPGYDPVPDPDANPLDGRGEGGAGGHGSHVTGTLAGYGLDAAGSRFAGTYSALTEDAVSSFTLGPGAAPQAGVYALKVFGDGGGASDLVGQALDWVGRALTEGKDIQVVNMSLGGDYSPADDPENLQIDALADRGVLSVVAAGNAGDLTDVGGAPGNAASALTVAAADVRSAAATLAPFSSRGGHGSYGGVVKPDVSAPGVGVVSARSGSGSGTARFSGTSMATPHTAGIAALAFQAHPGWSASRVKADLMNTADRDLRTGAGRSYPLLRQGTGAVDALPAAQNHTTVASRQNGGLVTASFGVVEVATSTTRTRTLTLTNTGPADVRYAAAYAARVSQSGVKLGLSSKSVTVPAKGTASVTLTLSVLKASSLRRVLDPTEAAKSDGYVREFVAAASGLVTFTPVGAEVPSLRLGVYAAVKPVSTLHGRTVTFAKKKSTTATLRSTGRTLDQGTATTGYHSLAAPFVLGATSARKSFTGNPSARSLAAADLRAVGASSNARLLSKPATGTVAFGVQTWGALANPGEFQAPVVLIDVNGDHREDFYTTVTKLGGDDVTLAVTYDTGNEVVDAQPYNVNRSGHDPNTFDSTVAVLPVSLAALGYKSTSKSTKINYKVESYSWYAPDTATQRVDSTAWRPFDVYKPALWFTKKGGSSYGQVVVPDNTSGLTVHRTAGTSNKVLLLHLNNAPTRQGDVLKVTG